MIEVRQGDVLEVLSGEPDNSFDGCFCDPPYGLFFMQAKWDHAVPGPDYWAEGCPVKMLDEQSGVSRSNPYRAPGSKRGSTICYAQDTYTQNYERIAWHGPGDSGGASRFFFCAKSSRRERNAGLENLPLRSSLTEQVAEVRNQDRYSMSLFCKACGRRNDYGCDCNAGWDQKPQPGLKRKVRNPHPTIKPLAVCEYLARLILPPMAYRDEAKLLVPFCGSGSEMIGAIRAGWRNVVGIEIIEEYVAIARARLAVVQGGLL